MNLKDKAVLVTGASRGLGAGLARSFAADGARVVLVGRDRVALDAVASDVRTAGGEAHVLVADVGRKDAIHPLAGAATALVGALDVVVHDASVLGPNPLRLLLDTDCEDLEAALAVNLVGPFRLTKALVGAMALRRRGLVLFVSSDAAVTAYPRWGAYGVSKAAADHLARSFAVELEPLGVKVLTVDPGEMDTKMHADAVPDADRSTLADPDRVAARIVGLVRESEARPTGSRIEIGGAS